jgi:hypothetical protein
MAILKDGTTINGDLTVSGDIYINGDTTGLMNKINSNYVKIKQMLGKITTLPVATNGLIGTVNSQPIAYMIGNTLRTSFNVTFSTSFSGNADNLSLGTVTFTHNGKIRAKTNSAFMDGTYGGQAAGWISVELTDTTIALTYELSASGNAFTRIGVYAATPVAPNLDAF